MENVSRAHTTTNFKQKTYPFALTSFSETTKGIFRDNLPPEKAEDVLMELQAILCENFKGQLRGKMLIMDIKERLGAGPFDVQLYIEKRNPPYRTVGYRMVRTLKGVVLQNASLEPGDWYYDRMVDFTAEEDTGWEEIDYTFEEYK